MKKKDVAVCRAALDELKKRLAAEILAQIKLEAVVLRHRKLSRFRLVSLAELIIIVHPIGLTDVDVQKARQYDVLRCLETIRKEKAFRGSIGQYHINVELYVDPLWEEKQKEKDEESQSRIRPLFVQPRPDVNPERVPINGTLVVSFLMDNIRSYHRVPCELAERWRAFQRNDPNAESEESLIKEIQKYPEVNLIEEARANLARVAASPSSSTV